MSRSNSLYAIFSVPYGEKPICGEETRLFSPDGALSSAGKAGFLCSSKNFDLLIINYQLSIINCSYNPTPSISEPQ
ncbi:Uncharacterized protein dnm_085400 [Desulfonema magnum]|uniref:Uncharacterized protein n=1 Tax=Desulfonema magnum TaxID=45655 RepID=A0A975GSV7_9BACT|nr:Uncharacterized protein dnm_085400 [Desulfonema magnum]